MNLKVIFPQYAFMGEKKIVDIKKSYSNHFFFFVLLTHMYSCADYESVQFSYVTVSPTWGVPAQLVFVDQPSFMSAAGTPFAQQPTVMVQIHSFTYKHSYVTLIWCNYIYVPRICTHI